MAKPKKTPRPKAETPKGFRDYFGAEVTERAAMLDTIAEVYRRYGFEALESPAVETLEALGKYLPDVDRPHAGVFAWAEDEDDGKGDWLALRYDLTAPLARVYAQHRNDLPTPYRRYAMGPVWRNEKPGPGRYRQFYQCDADTVGAASVAADAEICAMLADTLEAVGIPRGDYIVRVNNRKVLNGVVDRVLPSVDELGVKLGVTRQNAFARLEEMMNAVLRTIDKFDKVGEAGVRELLGEGRRDTSGAFIEGVGLANEQIDSILQYLQARSILDEIRPLGETSLPETPGDVNTHVLNVLLKLIGLSAEGREGVDELMQISNLLAAQGYGPDRIVIDPSVVRGLG
ncbi:ATP phosphoribosyltransferase regulatory subunit, partial [Rhodosalinus sp.]|uniref:ATP phosphoribosyltransferase regulatory subunit n=1 Tax=Rhodosalinus sp. TaxID=2047741 RepID=UPI00397DC65C